MKNILKNCQGNGGLGVIITAALILAFIIFPVWSFIVEKHLINIKSQIMIDAIDAANYSIYTTLDVQNTSKTVMDFNSSLSNAYKTALAKNLKLNDDLTPKEDSVAEGTVIVNSLVVYSSGFPLTCPNGKTINRPTVHAVVTIPINRLYIGKPYLTH